VPSVHAQLVSTAHGARRTAHDARWTRVCRWMDSVTHRKWSPWQGRRTSWEPLSWEPLSWEPLSWEPLSWEPLSWELPPAVVLACEQDSRSAREPSAPALATILNGFTLTGPDLAGSTDPLLQAHLIMPEPCDCSGERLPACASIRSPLDQFGGCRDGQCVHGRRAVHRAVVGVLYHTDASGQGRGCRPTRVLAGPGRGWSADSQGCLEEGASCSTLLPLLSQRAVAAG
jgi:hypothetical protein